MLCIRERLGNKKALKNEFSRGRSGEAQSDKKRHKDETRKAI